MTSVPEGGGPASANARLGSYRLVSTLGEGGMGVVHLGLDHSGRAVAIKVLRPHVAYDAESRRRLAREVATLERVKHRLVAAVLDADPDGPRPYVVTQYVPGPSLEEVITSRGPMPPADLVRLGRGLVEALEAIHAAGVVHRDLKPGNVLMLDDEPVVIDFGIAHVADDVRLTSTGLVMGTPGYLSPEVVEGGAVTEATDWWGWAATLAFAASGQPPFGRGPMNIVLDRVRHGRHDLGGVDPRLRPLLAAALSPVATDRPAAREVLGALEVYSRGGEATVPTPIQGAAGAGSAAPTVAAPIGATRRLTAVPPLGERVSAPRPVPTGPSQSAPQAPISSYPRTGPEAGAPASGAPAATPGAAAPAGSTGWTTGVGAGDPRIGRPTRTSSLAALMIAILGLAATWPMIALMVAVSWALLARTVDRSVTALVLRRHAYGAKRGSDVALAVLASPAHVIAAALSTVLGVIGSGLIGVAAAYVTSWVLPLVLGRPVSVASALPLLAGMAVAIVFSWWGPGGVPLRRGSRSIMRGIAPDGTPGDIVTSALAVLGIGLLVWSLLSHGVPSWLPLTDAPLGDALSWNW